MPKARSVAKKSFLRTKKTHPVDFSALKPGKVANSPRSQKSFEGEYGDRVIYGRAMSYRGVFEQLPTEFWQRVIMLRRELREAARRQHTAGHSGSGWTETQKKARVAKTIHGDPASNSYFSTELRMIPFVDTFLETINASNFPERSEARARFLAESIAGYGGSKRPTLPRYLLGHASQRQKTKTLSTGIMDQVLRKGPMDGQFRLSEVRNEPNLNSNQRSYLAKIRSGHFKSRNLQNYIPTLLQAK